MLIEICGERNVDLRLSKESMDKLVDPQPLLVDESEPLIQAPIH